MVRIPTEAGRITYKKKGGSRYVQFETGRRYDKERQFNLIDRKIIGIQIPAWPEYMMPNENYPLLFPAGSREPDGEEEERITGIERERAEGFMVRDFFEHIFYEIQRLGRKTPDMVVNEFKVRKLNEILGKLREIMKDETCAGYMELIPMPREVKTEDGGTRVIGMTYSDVMMILTTYRVLEGEYFQKLWLG